MTMTPSVLFDLSGKTALVTGGATGIGRMATTGLMAAGARVLIASRKGEGCVAVSTELNGLAYRAPPRVSVAMWAQRSGLQSYAKTLRNAQTSWIF